MRKHWWEGGSPVDPFQAALAFMPALPAPEASAALRNRANVLRGSAEFFRAAIESGWAADRKPPHVTWQFERGIALAEAEARWCDRIATLVEDGAPYQPAPDAAGDPGAWGRPMPGTPERPIIKFDAPSKRG